jgi:glutamate racemase
LLRINDENLNEPSIENLKLSDNVTMPGIGKERSPIGIFDSGVGGLSVLRAIRQKMPCENAIFIADQAHVPYGPRPLDEVLSFAEGITRFLLEEGSKLIVVACNAASAAALYSLRQMFPQIPFVGMEPAVKPAAELTHSKVVGVLATPATFQGALYASVVERFARDVTLVQHTCPGLVSQIEAGELESPRTRAILEEALSTMLERGIDTVVLGCTHYPFVIPLIEDIVGPSVQVIDPAPAVARQVGRMLDAHALRNPGPEAGGMRYLTSGDPPRLQAMLPALIGETGSVEQLVWEQGKLQHA